MPTSTPDSCRQRKEITETERLYDELAELYPYVRNLVRREIGDVPQWEDTVQEVYVSCYSTLAKNGFNGHCTLKTFLYRITMRRIYDTLRRNYKKLPSHILDDYVEQGVVESPEDTFQAKETKEKVASGFFVLNPRERKVFNLILSGWAIREIAQIMKVSPRWISEAHISGLRKLRKLYGVKNGKRYNYR